MCEEYTTISSVIPMLNLYLEDMKKIPELQTHLFFYNQSLRVGFDGDDCFEPLCLLYPPCWIQGTNLSFLINPNQATSGKAEVLQLLCTKKMVEA